MNKALLVIDVQEDFLGENRNKKKFNYANPELLIKNINKAIEKYEKEGYEIIYVANIIPKLSIKRLLFNFVIKGTDGAKLVKGLNIISENYFEKTVPNAFSNHKLCQLLQEKNIDKVVLCGIDEVGCVGETAKDAVRLDFKVSIIKNAVDTSFAVDKAVKHREHLKKHFVKYI